MFSRFILFLVLFIAIGQRPALASGLLPISKQELSSSEAIVGWSDIGGYATSVVDVMKVERVAVACADKRLFPTHPQQSTKLYHSFQAARYDHFKLKAENRICKISSKFKNSRGELTCLSADYLEYAVLSDTYQDACGNFYRGIWDVAFLKQDDNMGMLFAKGRTLYQKPTSDIENDMYVGQTYFLDESDFLILTPLFAGDFEKIQKLKNEAAVTHDYDPRTFLFSPK